MAIHLRFLLASLSSAVLLSSLAAPAMAQEPEAPPPPSPPRQFGDGGVVALSLNHNLFVNMQDLLSGDEIQGSLFVGPHVSLGLAVGAQWLSAAPVNGGSSPQTNFIFHAGPRLGYDLRLSSFVSIWPQVGVDYRRYDSSSTTVTAFGPNGQTSSSSITTTANAFGVTVLAPVLIHPTRGFFVGAGPAFYADLSNSTSQGSQSQDNSKITSVGLMATIGGAF
jgi:hypothetical protein